MRKNRELWYSLFAALLITGIYVFVAWQTRAIPAASGFFGHLIGVVGFIMMLMTETLYSLRKRARLARWGNMSEWLRFHIFTGIVGPYLVLLHTSWKFNGLAGATLALTMIIVFSGFIGRYIYTRIPRALDGVEMGTPSGQLQASTLASARRALSIWHAVHIPIGVALFVASFIHIGAALYYATLLRQDEAMKNSRLGCLTPSGLIAAGLTIVIIVVISLLKGGVVFSSGALNATAGAPLGGFASHAEFSGQCRLCHAPFWDTSGMAARCKSCHTGIPAQLADAATLHGALSRSDPSLACRDCHPEHRGATAALTDFHGTGFPHDVLGYSLVGHARTSNRVPFICSDCHGADVTTFDLAICETCHTRIDTVFTTTHVLSFGTGCLSCHDGLDTYGSGFDHDRFLFPLSGKHSGTPCSACHLSARTVPDLQSAPTDCNSCHAGDDAHQGSLGTDCAACHTPAGWSPSTYDHNLAAFKLAGKHAGVLCESCHLDRSFKNTPTDCNSCHAGDDAHQGSLGPNCERCHTSAGWIPAAFDHNLAAFRLEGEHASVACDSCHLDKLYKNTPTDCNSCHAADDAHQGRFGTGCATCHSPAGWTPATFDHNLSAFKLTGKHANVACESCHNNGVFLGTPADCYSCHAGEDAHQGRFGTGCATCHTSNAWKPATFDHNLAAFKLTGQHATAACESCHANGVYQGTPTSCFACHSGNDAHQGRFGTNCASCHSTSGWTPASFDHNLSGFPLTGAHAGLSCTQCHTGGVFSGLSSACASCHSEPGFHAGLFGGMGCDQCHNTGSWTPASYNLSHPGDCDGNCLNHEDATCRDCHTSNLNTATCTKCHDSNNPDD